MNSRYTLYFVQSTSKVVNTFFQAEPRESESDPLGVLAQLNSILETEEERFLIIIVIIFFLPFLPLPLIYIKNFLPFFSFFSTAGALVVITV